MVCVVVLVCNAISICLFVFLAMQPVVFSGDFISLVQAQDWWVAVLDQLGSRAEGLLTGNLLLVLLMALVIIGTLIDSGVTLYKTIRAEKGIDGLTRLKEEIS